MSTTETTTPGRIRRGLWSATRRHRTDDTLARDLRSYTSKADLAELAAILDRYSDSDTESVRAAVDWTRAA